MHQDVDHDTTIDWHAREASKFKEGTYKCPPWLRCPTCNNHMNIPYYAGNLKPIPGHFAHVSVNNSDMIAYTKSEANATRDIQTQIKPGRYIKQFYPQFSDTQIAELAGLILLCGNLEKRILYAETPDDAEYAYRNGPQTCMTRETNQYKSHPIHPTRAYVGGDLKVAYVKNPQNGGISARALIWPEKKLYDQLSGDYGTYHKILTRGLEQQGYKNGLLVGARIKAIPPPTPVPGVKGRAFVAGCMDRCNHYRLDDGGEFLIVDPKGDFYEFGTRSGIFASEK